MRIDDWQSWVYMLRNADKRDGTISMSRQDDLGKGI